MTEQNETPLPEPRRAKARNWLPSLVWLIADIERAEIRRMQHKLFAGRITGDDRRHFQDGQPQTVLMYFNQSLRGLTPGATVDFRGVVLGEVKSIGIEYDPKTREFLMPVVVQLYPERLGRTFSLERKHSRPASSM